MTDAYERQKLSDSELGYCERYVEMLEKCHHESFLCNLQDDQQGLREQEMGIDFLI